MAKMIEEARDERQFWRVYKYPINPEINLPKGSIVLSVQCKCDGAFLYAQVPANETQTEPHHFYIVPTGVLFDATGCTYIGSFIEDNYYIYHVYEEKGESI